MPYHVMIWPKSAEQQKLRELYALNIDEGQLRERFIEPYEEGRPITWEGRTLPAGDFGTFTITETDAIQHVPRFEEYSVVKAGTEVTNDWIKGPPGESAARHEENSGARRNPKRVMVVHGRNKAARNAMFMFLRAVGLEPIEWEEAVAQTGKGSPHNLDAVRSAMAIAQAVVVILTAEDQAGVLPDLVEDGEDLSLQGQPRQNVILEAGLAMGSNPQRTILVELGPIRRASDFDGLNAVRLNNDGSTRGALRNRLRNAGCAVSEDGNDWMHPETGGDFDVYIAVQPSQAPQPRATHAEENPYSRAAALQRKRELDRFLDMHAGIDQPFSARDLADSMNGQGLDEEWAEATLEKLAEGDRVYRALSGTGWHSRERDVKN